MGMKKNRNTATEVENMEKAKKTLMAIKQKQNKVYEENIKELLSFYEKRSKDEPVEKPFKVIHKGLLYQEVWATSKNAAKKLLVKNGLRKFKVIDLQ